MGASIAQALKVPKHQDGYFENSDYCISWCIGHLVELVPPDHYDPKYQKWNKEDLPIVPDPWKFQVSKGKEKQFALLKKLMNRSDVSHVVCATDAGREGELIFRLVYEQAGCTKPIERLWISSMEDSAILEGINHLKDGSQFDSLYESALCRAKADWLVGMNASRLFSILYGSPLRIGRVVSPTLSMLTKRENEIKQFVSEDFYIPTVQINEVIASGEKTKDREVAEKIIANCQDQEVTVYSIETENKTTAPPKLYDLTNIQREANRFFGYTAQETLDALQELYENKQITYPRTDSQFLTEDMEETVLSLLIALKEPFPFLEGSFSVKPLLCNEKVSDHHALLPTLQSATEDKAKWKEIHRNVWLLLVRRLCAAASPKEEMQNTTIRFACGEERFSAKGKTVLVSGWKGVFDLFDLTKREKKETILPLFEDGQSFVGGLFSIKKGQTVPPKYYSEDTLLHSMECAGKEEIPKEAERAGIGTPATRAATIEKLIESGLVTRSKKELLSTEKGAALTAILPDSLLSPSLTAQWETTLLQIGETPHLGNEFLSSVKAFLEELVQNSETNKAYEQAFASAKKEPIGVCPRCGGSVFFGAKHKNYYCENRACSFALWEDNKFFSSMKKKLTKSMVMELLSKGETFVKGFVSKKTEKSFDATVILKDTGQYINFDLDFKKK